ncbi:hypothetical protein PHLGIDRAFT_92252 [Phlebiopsis gigantea 11061_1 CR5-6]|uniref:SHSP domain-containing protein n=1 Tax=Phlebiopsis gigantea (strain 11061_1 CR5-6) TaxID=745531 RepID=A0A0C3S8I4_PHLG1|nr:hypothetical protein PHLGIDRAFT_92252 [Phlebiopsis gigantea 11061_1 CR5-6]
MSLARQFFRELRPLFRVLEEPIGRNSAYMGFPASRFLLEDPFFHHPSALRPAVDVSEQGNNYVVEADLPGVKKENVQVRVGDAGQSVTIEGKIVERRSSQEASQAETSSGTGSLGTKAVTTPPESTQISSERSFVGTSTFTRTVWLPRRVDPNNVSAKLDDGVLTVTIPKAQDPGSVEVPVQ